MGCLNHDTGGARHGTDVVFNTGDGMLWLWLDCRTCRRIREREKREMIENWQPWFDILLLLGTCVILSPVLYYIDSREATNRRENDGD